MKLSSCRDVPGLVRWMAGISLAHHYASHGQLIDYDEEHRQTLTEQTILWLNDKNYDEVTVDDVHKFQFADLEAHLSF